jgi:hypothetical protein
MRKLMILGLAIVASAAFAIQNSAAQCSGYAYVEAMYDTNLPKTSGPYDPCFSWLTWTYNFNRNSNYPNSTTIAFEVLGAPGTRRTYSDREYPNPGTYRFSETVFVGTTSYNEVQITRPSGPGGTFIIMYAEARYNNGDPQ